MLLPLLLPDGDLDWAAHSGGYRTGRLGLREPDGPPLGTAAIRRAELVVVPALAVGRDGFRMGRGGGSYDRALARLAPAGTPDRHVTNATPESARPAFVVALLHDGELLDAVPAEPHDRAVHAVVTPGRGLEVLNEPPGWTK